MELSAGKLGYGFWANNESFREREDDEPEAPTLRPMLTDDSADPADVQVQPNRGRKLSGDEAAAERFGLNQSLRPILAATGADDAATLTRAVQFLQKEGARSLADVAKYGLAEALLPAESCAVAACGATACYPPGRFGDARLRGLGCAVAALSLRSSAQAAQIPPKPSPTLHHSSPYPPTGVHRGAAADGAREPGQAAR